jgi:hypothetical protein
MNTATLKMLLASAGAALLTAAAGAETNRVQQIQVQRVIAPEKLELRTTGAPRASRPLLQRANVGGALSQIRTADNPLQLINPAAPPEYGSGDTNLVRDFQTRRPVGWALLTFNF